MANCELFYSSKVGSVELTVGRRKPSGELAWGIFAVDAEGRREGETWSIYSDPEYSVFVQERLWRYVQVWEHLGMSEERVEEMVEQIESAIAFGETLAGVDGLDMHPLD